MPDALSAILDRLQYYHDDANWEESKHPRDADGKFSSTGGGGAGKAKPGTIPKIAASQGKPYEHIFNAAHDPALSDEEKLDKINSLITDFQNKYKGGYLKSISKYGDNVKLAMETGEWKGKKKGAGPVDEPGGTEAAPVAAEPPAALPKGGNKAFTQDGPKAASIMNFLQPDISYWEEEAASNVELTTHQKAALNAWEEIKGAKELSDTPEQYLETLQQINISTEAAKNSALAGNMKDYLEALKDDALHAALQPEPEPKAAEPASVETAKEKKDVHNQYEEVVKSQLAGTEEDDWLPDDITAADVYSKIESIKKSNATDEEKLELLNKIDPGYEGDELGTEFSNAVLNHLEDAKNEYHAKAHFESKSEPTKPAANEDEFDISPESAEKKYDLKEYINSFHNPTGSIKQNIDFANQKVGEIENAFQNATSKEQLANMIHAIDVSNYDMNSALQLKTKSLVDKLKKEHPLPPGSAPATAQNAAPSPAMSASNPTQTLAQKNGHVPLSQKTQDKAALVKHKLVTQIIPPQAKKNITKKMAQIQSYLNSAEKGSLYAISALKNMEPVKQPAKWNLAVSTCNDYIASIKSDYQNGVQASPAATPVAPTPPPIPTKQQPKAITNIGAKAASAGEEVNKSLGLMTSEANKKTVQEHMEKIDKAVQQGSLEEQKEALSKLTPIEGNNYSQGIKNYNAYLEALKEDFGVEKPSLVSSPAAFKAAVQNLTEPSTKTKVWHRLKALFDNAHDTQKGLTAALMFTHNDAAWNHIEEPYKKAFTTYTGGSYQSINNALRNNQSPGEHLLDTIHKMEELFDEDKAEVKQDIKLYRGEEVDQKEIDGWIEGLKKNIPQKIQKKGFISTRTTRGTGYGSGKNVQYDIAVPKGKKALNVKPISLHKSENEVVLPHGQSYEILGIEKVGSQYYVSLVAL